MSEKKEVLCVGLIIRDMFFMPVEKSVFSTSAVVIEEPIIQFGGDALNQSVVLRRMGVSSALAGAVGNDEAGAMALKFLQEQRVDTSQVEILPECGTTCSYVLCEPSGEHHFLCCGEAKNKYIFQNFDALNRFRLVSLGSLACMERMDRGGFLNLLKEAKKRNVLTAADFSGPFQGSADELRELLQYIDYLWPSYEEAAAMTGEKGPGKMIGRLLELGAGNIILKLGKEGCLVYDKKLKNTKHIPNCRVQAVDTTGAGDNFVAGCIYGIIQGMPLFEASKYGCAAGAVAVTEVGANKAVKDLKQVEEMYRQCYGI